MLGPLVSSYLLHLSFLHQVRVGPLVLFFCWQENVTKHVMIVTPVCKQPNARVAKTFSFRESTEHVASVLTASKRSQQTAFNRAKNAPLSTSHVKPTTKSVFTRIYPANWAQTAHGARKTVFFLLIEDYVSEYYVNSDEFTGSLFSVNGASSTYKCGDYSVVGLANRGESITRVFTTIGAHQALSLTFNVMIIDQTVTQKSIFEIYIDNVRV